MENMLEELAVDLFVDAVEHFVRIERDPHRLSGGRAGGHCWGLAGDGGEASPAMRLNITTCSAQNPMLI